MFKLVLVVITLNGSILHFEVNNLPNAPACETARTKLAADVAAAGMEIASQRYTCTPYKTT